MHRYVNGEERVHCSWCEPRLDRYLEGTLRPREMRLVDAHLPQCSACASLLAELRVVDALLATPTRPQLPPNFTFAVMADVREMPLPVGRRRVSFWAGLSFYTIAVWLSMIAFATQLHFGTLTFAFAPQRAALTHALGALVGVWHAIGSATPIALAGGICVLAIDVILLALVILFYRTIRPRLRARLAHSEAL